MPFGNIGTIWAEIGLDTKKLQTGVSTAKMQLSALDRQAMTQAASINAKLNSIGSGLQSVGRNMSMYITLPLMAIGAAAIKSGMDFESGMTKSLAIMNNVSPQIRSQMEKTAKSIVDYTTFSAKEGADAYFYLASAGLDAAQSMEALPRVAKFAQAGNFDLALATDLLTDAQSALGLTIRDDVVKNMENMTRVSDVLVKANTLSNATVQQFSESLTNKAGAALKLLNKDIEEGVAVLAAWADQGVKGAEAGNYLNIVLRDLQSATIKNEEVFSRFNINVYDTSGNMRNMADIIGDLEVALDGMSDKEKRATLMMLGFQDRSISAMMTLLGTSDAIRGYESDLRSATGFTEDVATKQMESFTAQVEQLKNQLINVGIEIFDILKPKLESLLEQVKKGIDWFNSLTETQKNLVVNLGIFAAAIGPVLIGLGSMVRAVATLRTAFISLRLAASGVLGPVSAAIAILTAHGLLIKELSKDIENDYGQALLRGTSLITSITQATNTWQMATKVAEDRNLSLFKVLFSKRSTITEMSDEIDRQAELYDKVSKAVSKYIEQFPEIASQLQDLIDKYNEGELSQEGFEQATADLIQTTQDYIKYQRLLNEAIKPRDIEFYEEKVRELADTLGIAADEEGNFGEVVDSTTESIEDQEQSVDDLRQAYNELIDEIFGITNAENDLQESEWALEDATKAVAEATEEFGEGSREAEEKINDYDDALQDNLRTLGELYTEEGISIERKEELRQKLIELLEQTQETSGLSQEEYVNMSQQFGLSGQEIIDMAGDVGIELDEATKERILEVDASSVPVTVKEVVDELTKIKNKTVYIDTIYRTFKEERVAGMTPYDPGGAMGGIVKAYAGGGIIGNDGAKIPMLTASMGIITPQTGREIPILAHENEIIANTSQQRNLAEWIMGKANTRPSGSGNGIIIENLNVITPKGTPADIANETEFLMRKIGMEYSLR